MSTLPMNLILLLSALLSALTGISQSARAVEQPALTRPIAAVAPTSAAAVRAQSRPVQPLLALTTVAAATIATRVRGVVSIPALLTNRRRE
jgi:hypothetical protein